MRLVICVTFHYVEGRLTYLRQSSSRFPRFADHVELVVFTNTHDEQEISSIRQVLPEASNLSVEVRSIGGLSHPFLLTWAHKDHFRYVMAHRLDIDAFMYLEDDIDVRPETIEYWFSQREVLKPFGLYPSFFRVERHPDNGRLISVDIEAPIDLTKWPRVEISEDLHYYNLSNTYQGMYLFDRELMEEHIEGPAMEVGWGPGRYVNAPPRVRPSSMSRLVSRRETSFRSIRECRGLIRFAWCATCLTTTSWTRRPKPGWTSKTISLSRPRSSPNVAPGPG